MSPAGKFNPDLATRFETYEYLGEPVWHVDGDQQFLDFMFRLPNSPEWIAVATFQDPAGEPFLHSLTLKPVKRWTKSPGLTTKIIRSVTLSELCRRAQSYLQTRGVRDALGRAPSDDFSKVPRPGRAGRSDLPYARLAARYVEYLDRPRPVVQLARALRRSESQIRSGLYEARRRGLLTASPPGKAGGALTRKADRSLGRDTR